MADSGVRRSVKWSHSIIPTVMTDALLSEWALKNYCETPEAQKLVEEEGIEFPDVEVLKVEFKNILKISNLWDFKALKHLVLSNNRIEKIEGLDNLMSLVKLDLSFNNIEVIAGLDNLKTLSDLNLAHNKILKLENLDALKSLQILLMNDNQIDDISGVQYLYEFRSMRSVSFNGNPIAGDADYEMKVIAYMPALHYLDFRLISADMKTKALAKYKCDVEELEEKVKLHEKTENEKALKTETERFSTLAFLDGISDHQLFEDFMSCHCSSNLLLTFPTFTDVSHEFPSAFYNVCNDWAEVGVKEYNQRNDEVSFFTDREQQLVAETLHSARKEVFDFSEFKEHILLKIVLHDADDELEERENQKLIEHFNSEVKSLWKKLMTYEISLAQHLSVMYNLLCTDLSAIVEGFESKISNYMQQLQKLNDELTDNAVNFYAEWCSKPKDEKNQVIKTAGSDCGGLDAKLLELLRKDHQTLKTILTEGHDVRAAVLKDKELSVTSRLRNWLTEIISRTQETELERHRQRIREIILYCDTAKKELEVVCRHTDLLE